MSELKVCFVGIGSIAKRHIKNLNTVCAERGMELRVDAFRRSGDPVEGVRNIYSEIASVPTDYDVIFITNPTDKHLDALKAFQEKGKHFFIEKPVVALNQVDDARNLDTRRDAVYYVAAPLRYNAVIQWIKDNVERDDVISVRSISSSYLPDWRPGQDYRETYSAHRSLGGGVSIDLIHEWDYITYLFGWPEKIHGLIGKKSSLEIDSDDYAIYIAEYKGLIAELHLDYFGRKTIREIQLFTREDTIVGDITSNTIRLLVKNETIDFHEERDDYQRRELNHFLDMIAGKRSNEDGFHHGIDLLCLTQEGTR